MPGTALEGALTVVSFACQWDELKREIRRNPEFRFDWIFKSRTPQELSRRVDLLIRLVVNETKDTKEGGRGAATKRPAEAPGPMSAPVAKVAKPDVPPATDQDPS